MDKAQKLSEIEAIRGHELGEDEARERLREFVGDADDEVRAEAASAIWEHTDAPDLVEVALRLSAEDASSLVRVKALTALGRVVYEGDIAGVELPGYVPDGLLGEPSPELFKRVREHLVARAKDEARPLDERRFALEGLGFLGSDREVSSLIESFWGRPEAPARLSAVFAMGRSGDPRWSAKVQEALASDDAELRLQAIWAAGEAEVAPAGPALARLAREGASRDERVAAIEALARLGGELPAKVLLEIAEGAKDPELREAAAQGLEEIALLDSVADPEDEASDEEGEPREDDA